MSYPYERGSYGLGTASVTGKAEQAVKPAPL